VCLKTIVDVTLFPFVAWTRFDQDVEEYISSLRYEVVAWNVFDCLFKSSQTSAVGVHEIR
jgi:hypothetical protein